MRRITELAPRFATQLGTIPVADEESAERGARTLPPGVAADDKIRAVRGLDLHPRCRAPAALVSAFLALADHALEAVGERRGLQRRPVFRCVHKLHPR